jgi:hypothetical protein
MGGQDNLHQHLDNMLREERVLNQFLVDACNGASSGEDLSESESGKSIKLLLMITTFFDFF